LDQAAALVGLQRVEFRRDAGEDDAIGAAAHDVVDDAREITLGRSAVAFERCGHDREDARQGFHDFTAPAVRPWMKKRCTAAKAITTGSDAISDDAIAPPQSLRLSPR